MTVVPKGRGGGLASQSLKALLGIRDLIHSGQVAPGERMSEPVLTDRLGLSRTPIRAALARLEAEGLLEAIPSGGYAVRAFSDADVIDAIELRGVLEGMAARLAAERGVNPARLLETKGLLAKLDAVVAGPAESLAFEDYVGLNEAFHESLVTLAGSDVLRREIARAYAMPFASPSAFLEAQASLPEFRATLQLAQSHHRAIVEAIDLREGARAEALAREHARLARHNLAGVLDDTRLAARVPGLALMAGGRTTL